MLKGDCLDLMKTLPDKSIDCFLVDLPYGQLATGFEREGHSEELKKKVKNQSTEACAWDIKIDLVQFWEQVKRLCANDNTPVIMFCNTKFGNDLINSNPKWFRYDLVWNKGRGVSFLLSNKMPVKSHEMIYIFSKKGAYYERVQLPQGDPYVRKGSGGQSKAGRQWGFKGRDNTTVSTGGRCPLSVIDVKKVNKYALHPTMKPVELYKWLLERYCPEGGTVLDPTAGSFNSVFTASDMGYKAIGIEKDNTFFYNALNRLINMDLTRHDRHDENEEIESEDEE